MKEKKLTKREMKIRALYTVGRSVEMILDMEFTDIPESQVGHFYAAVEEVCNSLVDKAYKMQQADKEKQ